MVRKSAEEEEFENEINKVIAESAEARRKEGAGKALDVAVPLSVIGARPGTEPAPDRVRGGPRPS